MRRTRVKICGLTRVQDVVDAQEAGADALGLNFYPRSPRCIGLEQASALATRVAPLTTLVGLFVNPTVAEVRTAISAVGLQLLQFHGDEQAAFCSQFGLPWIKAIRVRDSQALKRQATAFDDARGLLLDTFVEGVEGGTGRQFDWTLIPELEKPYLLAGGLHPGNVGRAVVRCRPYGVDVSSGVESAPGIKDAAKMRAFIDALGAADLTVQEDS